LAKKPLLLRYNSPEAGALHHCHGVQSRKRPSYFFRRNTLLRTQKILNHKCSIIGAIVIFEKNINNYGNSAAECPLCPFANLPPRPHDNDILVQEKKEIDNSTNYRNEFIEWVMKYYNDEQKMIFNEGRK
jgi:hypothetical protein